MTHQDNSVILDQETKDAALDRIRYFANTKRGGCQVDFRAILEWFVSLAGEDLTKLTAQELAKREEEYRALKLQILDANGSAPSREELAVFQGTLIGLFTDLTTKGLLWLGPFQHQVVIIVSPERTPSLQSADSFVPRWYDGLHKRLPDEELLYILAQCLRHDGDLVKRCEWCGKIFLQARRVLSPSRERKYCCNYHRTLASKKRASDRKETKRQAAAQRAATRLANKETAHRSSDGKRRKTHGRTQR
jgi:hypothetical protein